MVLAAACSPDGIDTSFAQETVEEEPQDPVVVTVTTTRVAYVADSRIDCGISSLDYFIYSTDGTESLEEHKRLTFEENGIVEENSGQSSKGTEQASKQGHFEVCTASLSPRTVVAIANCPRAFNLDALDRMDSMELLSYYIADDDPSNPVLSASATLQPGTDMLLKLTPLMCRVNLEAVSNGMYGYELLEEPRVRLCDASTGARLLQLEDFRPAEVLEAGEWTELPCDVGFYTQHPGLSLFCYPNDTPETTLGSPHTSMELNCKIKGVECSFPITLPPLPRNSSTNVEILINGPDEYNCNVYQN